MIFVKAKPVLLFIRGHRASVQVSVIQTNEEEMHYNILKIFSNIMLCIRNVYLR